MTILSLSRWAATVALLALTAPVAQAQNLFAPVAQVNERVITAYERDQRARMLELFGSPGDPQEVALKNLIEERLQLEVAKRLGITVKAENVAEGMTEFAGRANLSREDFITALTQNGIEVESFRDFVAVGLAWREVIRQRFQGRANITQADVDAAIKREATAPGVRVLLSEIILPANTPAAAAAAQNRAKEITRITTLPAFASAARSYSASPSRGAGGRLEWLPIGNLPPTVAARILTLRPGEVTDPISIPNAVALFQLRALEEVDAATPDTLEVEYAAFYIPGGRSEAALAEAARIQARVDTCDDLYGVAKGLPPSVLQRSTVAAGAVPGDVALELAKLDENEVSTGLTRDNGQTLVFLMLCNRRAAATEDETVDRDAVRLRLLNQRLSSMASAYLAELRANATIRIE
ncbi:peptidylprolyl isomerase [Oceaniglobus ichthyenteri]|uniref:peptidylprolyl isomerase n=1 Tax=Oceaniglobus ichthyenteri TaxID=2136177 RepID=UPI000D37226F|nr:peptidylprolyl isomerase [Oceaniglobus ichthyenteri]